ncbi:hypothetical protein DL96DRAFT_1572577 [Flagelloscypha sp. PMI_526]|nr:hypothetical protein DL96DRAFT_1572577 [Flagelloscypha sp. PMI_526]
MSAETGIAFSRTVASSLISQVQSRLFSPPVHLVFSPTATWPSNPRSSQSTPLRISILDSSFNPPTRAHVALLKYNKPSSLREYDAKLLLLSVRNPDKTLKPGDATFVQRLAMMTAIAKDLGDNTAVAIIDEPLFFGKGKSLAEFLRKRLGTSNAETPKLFVLDFLLGMDTLERVVSPKYYIPNPSLTASSPETAAAMRSALLTFVSSPPDGHNCRIICARRDPHSYPQLVVEDDQSSPLMHAEDFIASGHITMMDIGSTEQTFSSSQVRKLVASGAASEWEKMVPESVAKFIHDETLYRS